MSEISELEARIGAALERIGRAVAVVEDRADSPAEGGIATEEMVAEIGRLNEALEHEREANQGFEARVKAIHERQEGHVAALEQEVAELRRQLSDHDHEMQRLRGVAERLRDNNAALREANAQGLGDAALIDAGLREEIEALKAARASEAAEVAAIVDELRGAMAQAATPAEEG